MGTLRKIFKKLEHAFLNALYNFSRVGCGSSNCCVKIEEDKDENK